MLGFEDEDLGNSPRLVSRYCRYLLPKQAGGTLQILIFKTLRMTGRLTVYVPAAGLQTVLPSCLSQARSPRTYKNIWESNLCHS